MNVLKEIKSNLYPWQLQWLDDQTLFKIALKARQIGWTEICALEALLHAIRFDGHHCYMVSTKVGNARRQMLNRIKQRWIPALEQDDVLGPMLREAKINKNMIELPNGSKIFAVANKPSRLRGNESSSYWFDEIAFWLQRILEELQDAVWPQIESENNPNAVVRLFSTPWDINFFANVWQNKDGMYPQFSRHKWTIVDAVKASESFNLDYESIKERYPKQKFEREYMCSFLSLGDTYFDRVSIEELERPTDDIDSEGWRCHLGVDLAKVNDLSSIVQVLENGNHTHVAQTWLMKSIEYTQQAKALEDIIDLVEPDTVNVDTTVHQSFGSLVNRDITELRGNRERKVDNTEHLKESIENESFSFDWSTFMYERGKSNGFVEEPTEALLDDLCKVQQEKTPGGKIKYDAPRDETGHADSYSALLLAMNGFRNESIPNYIF